MTILDIKKQRQGQTETGQTKTGKDKQSERKDRDEAGNRN